jgi:uncharacterized protein involved in exopolysaccharide biosynthesis
MNAEDFNTQIKILESLKIVQAVDDRLKGSERARFLAPYEKGLDATLRGTRSVAEILHENRNVSPVRLSLVVNILYTHPDPEIAASVANYFAEEYIDFNRNQQIEGSMRAVDDLRSQADQQLAKIKDLENRLADFKEKYDTVSVERGQDVDNQQFIALNARLEEDKRAYDEASTLVQQIESARDRGEPLWELSFISNFNQQVPELLNQYSLIKIELSSLSKKFRSKHPKMQAVQERLEETERELQRAVESAAAAVRNQYERAKANYEKSQERIEQARLPGLSTVRCGHCGPSSRTSPSI